MQSGEAPGEQCNDFKRPIANWNRTQAVILFLLQLISLSINYMSQFTKGQMHLSVSLNYVSPRKECALSQFIWHFLVVKTTVSRWKNTSVIGIPNINYMHEANTSSCR